MSETCLSIFCDLLSPLHSTPAKRTTTSSTAILEAIGGQWPALTVPNDIKLSYYRLRNFFSDIAWTSRIGTTQSLQNYDSGENDMSQLKFEDKGTLSLYLNVYLAFLNSTAVTPTCIPKWLAKIRRNFHFWASLIVRAANFFICTMFSNIEIYFIKRFY